jgi:predicted nucleic acid-binding Zn ribbon protein
MYCAACGTQLAPGLSFCNRCGMGLKEPTKPKSNAAAIIAFLTAITMIGVVGLGIMLGGALTLAKEAHIRDDIIGVFMMFTFLIVLVTEIMLVRQLSRFTGNAKAAKATGQVSPVNEFQSVQPPRSLAENLPSVTENTTRTLEYSRNEPLR